MKSAHPERVLALARRFALSLPETAEAPHFEMSSWRVRGKIFVTVPPGGEHLHVFVDEHEAAAAVSGDPGCCEELRWGRRLSGVRVKVAAVDPERLCELIEDAWRRKAPKGVVAAYEASPGLRHPSG